jgi:hypothetical protein
MWQFRAKFRQTRKYSRQSGIGRLAVVEPLQMRVKKLEIHGESPALAASANEVRRGKVPDLRE